MIFEEKNWALAKLCQIVVGPQFQNITFKGCLRLWLKAFENLRPVTLKLATTKKCYLPFLKVAPATKFVP